MNTLRTDKEKKVMKEEKNRNTWIISVQHFKQFGDVADLQKAITLLEELVRSTLVGDERYRRRLVNLSVVLLY